MPAAQSQTLPILCTNLNSSSRAGAVENIVLTVCTVLQVREGCFAVDTAPFRATVEAHAAAALAALGRTMHSSASRDRDAIAEFSGHSRALLRSEAASLSELGEARVQVSSRVQSSEVATGL